MASAMLTVTTSPVLVFLTVKVPAVSSLETSSRSGVIWTASLAAAISGFFCISSLN